MEKKHKGIFDSKELQESEVIELKKSTSELKEGIISICAILNKHQKGKLYFGIRNDGCVVGQSVSEKTIRDISKSISDNIEPKIFPKINPRTLDGKKCIQIEFTGDDIPYYAFGRAYMRVGDEDRKISPQELEKIILKKNKDALAWDKEICKEATIDDINIERLKWFLKKAKKSFDGAKNSLGKLGLLSEGKLRNTAVILFGKNPIEFFPNAKLRCAVFGMTTAVTIDMQEFTGDLFTLIEEAEKYILKNIHIGMELDGMFRVDVPEINKKAFREAIINAFCHRNYYLYDSVNIAVFKDCLEVRSPGKLYGDLTINRIKKGKISERRNELLSEMFHLIQFVERWGRGINLILSREPKTEFEEIGRQFIVTFRRKRLEWMAEELDGGLVERLAENQKRILGIATKNPRVSKREISNLLRISTTAIDKNIKILKRKGLLKRVGSAKGGLFLITIPKRREYIFGDMFVEGLVEGLAENQKKILKLIAKNSYLSKREMALSLEISTTAIDQNIITLKKKGFLKRIGPAKGGHWEIIK